MFQPPIDVFTLNCNRMGKPAKLTMILTKALKAKINNSIVIQLQETKTKTLQKLTKSFRLPQLRCI